MGPRYTHGHVVDFVRSLKVNPNLLTILGDGNQFKSYFHVDDCINAMLLLGNKLGDEILGFMPINLGTEEGITVFESAKIISDTLNLKPKFKFTGGKQGWIGDNPIIQLDISRAKDLGWRPTYSISNCIRDTTNWVYKNF